MVDRIGAPAVCGCGCVFDRLRAGAPVTDQATGETVSYLCPGCALIAADSLIDRGSRLGALLDLLIDTKGVRPRTT